MQTVRIRNDSGTTIFSLPEQGEPSAHRLPDLERVRTSRRVHVVSNVPASRTTLRSTSMAAQGKRENPGQQCRDRERGDVKKGNARGRASRSGLPDPPCNCYRVDRDANEEDHCDKRECTTGSPNYGDNQNDQRQDGAKNVEATNSTNTNRVPCFSTSSSSTLDAKSLVLPRFPAGRVVTDPCCLRRFVTSEPGGRYGALRITSDPRAAMSRVRERVGWFRPGLRSQWSSNRVEPTTASGRRR